MVPVEDWFDYLTSNEGSWGNGIFPTICQSGWPAGWGGDITDSIAQEAYAAGTKGAFAQSIALNEAGNIGKKMVEIERPANYVIMGDGGAHVSHFGIELLAFPDICALCNNGATCDWSGEAADWEVMAQDDCCGADYDKYAPMNGAFLANAELRKRYARHLGGVNIGFLDGHATWVSSGNLVNMCKDGDIDGVEHYGPVSDCIVPWTGNLFSEDYPDAPTIW